MNKSKRFGLVLTATETRVLKQLAEAEGGLSKAATVRRLIRQEARRLGLWNPSTGDAQPRRQEVSQ